MRKERKKKQKTKSALTTVTQNQSDFSPREVRASDGGKQLRRNLFWWTIINKTITCKNYNYELKL